MEIVINIPEEDYERIRWNKMPELIMRRIIMNGIILPKGHGRLIDVKQIVTEDECIWNSDGSCTTITTYNIDSTPTIIEADK